MADAADGLKSGSEDQRRAYLHRSIGVLLGLALLSGGVIWGYGYFAVGLATVRPWFGIAFTLVSMQGALHVIWYTLWSMWTFSQRQSAGGRLIEFPGRLALLIGVMIAIGISAEIITGDWTVLEALAELGAKVMPSRGEGSLNLLRVQ